MKYELSIEDQKWNKMCDLWTKGEVPSPYSELMEYSSEVNNGGHAQFFSNLNDLGELDDAFVHVKKILPEVLKEKVILAYNEFKKDEFSDETETLCSECDDIFYKNEDLINEILKQYASTLKL